MCPAEETTMRNDRHTPWWVQCLLGLFMITLMGLTFIVLVDAYQFEYYGDCEGCIVLPYMAERFR